MTALRTALKAAGCAAPVHDAPEGEGAVQVIKLTDGTRVVAKTGAADDLARFEEEVAGLHALAATDTVRVVTVIDCAVHKGRAVLLLEHLEHGEADWTRFGVDLAALHQAPAGSRYGFDHDNHLGPTPQSNHWCDDWVEFNRTMRLEPMLDRAEASLGAAGADEVRAVIDRLTDLLPARPFPALLHGDLWSGNALATERGVTVIDPACSIGDGWADIAMMQLFGGFPDACFASYAQQLAEDVDPAPRLAVYQLYHLLNHVVIFGSGYAGQTISTARRALALA